MKQTVIQCITAIVCVVAICITSVVGIGKISDAKIEAVGSSNSQQTGSSETGEEATDPVSGEVATDPSSSEVATDPVSGEDTTAAAPGETTAPASDSTTAQAAGGSTTKPASTVPSTPTAIADCYNAAINKVISSKAGYKKSRVTSMSNLNGGALLKISLVVDTVNDFLGVGTTPYTNAKGKAEFMSNSSVKAADITSATCTESNGIYTISMTLKNGANAASASGSTDTTALGRCGLFAGTGDKKAYDYKSSLNLYKSINGLDEASVESINEKISNIKVSAKVDSKTGKLCSLSIAYNWTVSLTNVKYTIVTIKSASGDAVTTTTFSNFVW